MIRTPRPLGLLLLPALLLGCQNGSVEPAPGPMDAPGAHIEAAA